MFITISISISISTMIRYGDALAFTVDIWQSNSNINIINITTTSISISIMIRYGDALPCPVPQSSVARGTKVSGNKDAISYWFSTYKWDGIGWDSQIECLPGHQLPMWCMCSPPEHIKTLLDINIFFSLKILKRLEKEYWIKWVLYI